MTTTYFSPQPHGTAQQAAKPFAGPITQPSASVRRKDKIPATSIRTIKLPISLVWHWLIRMEQCDEVRN